MKDDFSRATMVEAFAITSRTPCVEADYIGLQPASTGTFLLQFLKLDRSNHKCRAAIVAAVLLSREGLAALRDSITKEIGDIAEIPGLSRP